MPELTILVVPVYSPLCNLAFALRREVFIVEQKVEDEEFDAEDRTATHLVAISEGAVVGTLRLITEPEHIRIGRVAVSQVARGQGVGRTLIEHAMAMCRARGDTKFYLSAQAAKTGFYEKLGFSSYGGPYDDGSGILHVAMKTY